MAYSDEDRNIRINLDTKGCDLTAGEISAMEEDLHTLRQLVADFPVSTLYITVIYHGKSNDYHVKTSLVLPGKTLFTGDRAVEVHPAYEKCIRKLVKKVEIYKQRMQGDAELVKHVRGTRHTLTPTQELDIGVLDQAVAQDDYARFRRAVDVFEEALARRIGRWVQRYTELESQLGETVTISDIVEDVFLNAFEQFSGRPNGVSPGEWLENLIDPTVQAIVQSPDEEFAKISFTRAILERSPNESPSRASAASRESAP